MNQQQDIKEVIKLEYLKCAQDPAHFLSKYCQIQHPTRGRVHFQLYPFQSRVLNVFKENFRRSSVVVVVTPVPLSAFSLDGSAVKVNPLDAMQHCTRGVYVPQIDY